VTKKPVPAKPRQKRKQSRKRTYQRNSAAPKIAASVGTPSKFNPAKVLENGTEERFCQECLVQPNPTQAYISANPKVTYGSAGVMSTRLLKKVKVCQRIAFLLSKSADKTIMNKREAMRILTQRARADMADYAHCDAQGAKFVKFDTEVPNTKAVAEITTKTINRGSGESAETAIFTKLKLQDGERAIDKLAKMLGWYTAQEYDHLIKGQLTIADLVEAASDRGRGKPPEARGEKDAYG